MLLRLVITIHLTGTELSGSKGLPPSILTAATAQSRVKDYATPRHTRLESGVRSHSNHSPPRFGWDFGAFTGERRGYRREDYWGSALQSPVKSCLFLGFCLKTHYVEMVRVGGTL